MNRLTFDLMFDSFLGKLDSLIEKAITNGVFPGAALWVALNRRTIKCSTYGNNKYRLVPENNVWKIDVDTLYDLASLTKVIATTTAIMQLAEQKKLSLQDPISNFLPLWGESTCRRTVTISHLLTHTSGLPAHVRFTSLSTEELIDAIGKLDLKYPVGRTCVYTNLGFILLGAIVEVVSFKGIDAYCAENIFVPLGMKHTCFNPPGNYKVVPTEFVHWRGGVVQSQVHDESAFAMGGVSGHAGLFSSIADIAIFGSMLLNLGSYQGIRILGSESIMEMSKPKSTCSSEKFGLGWMVNSADFMGKLSSDSTLGHTGFTGTSIVINLERGLGMALLTNRVYPSRRGPSIGSYRKKLADILFDIYNM